jgi:ankyrin repeat protein
MARASASATAASGVIAIVATTLTGACVAGPTPAERALLTAARRGDVDGIERALAAGAAVDARDDYERTPLMRAAAFGHAHAIPSLLAAGADAMLHDVTDATVTHLAALGAEAGVLQALRSAGVDLTGQSEGGPNRRTALGGALDVYLTARASPADEERARMSLDTLRVLLESGASPDHAGSTTDTPLVAAIGQGDAALVGLLLDHGADPDLPSTARRTPPLVQAVEHCYDRTIDIVEMLLAAGANRTVAGLEGTAREHLTRALVHNANGTCREQRRWLIERLERP